MKRLGEKIEARTPLFNARKTGHVQKSGLKWQMREQLGKASVKRM
ncbi:MAG: hypothetical protein Q7U60_06110 [Candidatus Methanoperedens sp.]|nr:hypothetical protein [Candidatus Methanoperedens sp.]